MLESLFNKLFPVNIGKFLRAPILKNICERLLLNDGNSLSWIKSWKPIIAQYDTQPRRIKRLIVLLFLKAPLIVVKKVSTSQNVLTSRNVHGGGGLGHSLIIIKWTWGFFFQKFSIWTPPPPPSIRHKEYWYSILNQRSIQYPARYLWWNVEMLWIERYHDRWKAFQ